MHKVPDLGYDFDALAPNIDAKTMEIHHGKHHAGYVAKLNAALEGNDELLNMPVEEILADIEQVPEEIRTAVINNGGGHVNHALFWQIISPNGGGEPKGKLADAINTKYNSFADFKEVFSAAAATRFGSGWAWLVVTPDGDLDVFSTPNQDSPWMSGDMPIMGLDVWEHAYYLNYQNRRPDYIEAFWNTINWDRVSELFEEAVK